MKKLLLSVCAAAMVAFQCSGGTPEQPEQPQDPEENNPVVPPPPGPGPVNTDAVTIDASKVLREFQGLGALVSYGKLLYDYPEPQRSEIMDYLFKPGYGANLQILKMEIGSGSNNTAMSWPSHRRTLSEENDFNRGHCWWYMKEAKKRNPDIILCALNWGYPSWCTTDELRSDFIVDYVVGAYEVHGLRMNYIGGNQNESVITPETTKLIRRKLDAKGFGDVKIMAPDEGSQKETYEVFPILDADPAYRDVVDVLGFHYKSREDPGFPDKASSYGKPVWSSEDGGGAYHSVAQGFNWTTQIMHLFLDIRMSAAVRWLATASIYDNMPWPRNGIMRTKEPWSGNYVVGANLWAFAHFTQFTKPGWNILATPVEYVYKPATAGRFISFADPLSGDYTIVISTKDDKIPSAGADFSFRPEGLSSQPLSIWKSEFVDNGEFFVEKGTASADKDGVVTVHVDKNCVYTLSTTRGQGKGNAVAPPNHQWPLPYADDFESYGIDESPKYFVDANSTFAIAESGDEGHGKVLRQVLSTSPIIWHNTGPHTKQPLTEVGDMTWKDYTVQVDFKLENTGKVLLGARIDPATESSKDYNMEGIWFTINDGGNWQIISCTGQKAQTLKKSGYVSGISKGMWVTIALQCSGKTVSAFVNGAKVGEITDCANASGNIILGTLNGATTSPATASELYTMAQFDNFSVTK